MFYGNCLRLERSRKKAADVDCKRYYSVIFLDYIYCRNMESTEF